MSGVLVSLRVKASPERAFAVFTGEIGAWWKPNPLFRFAPQGPAQLALEAGLGGCFTERQPDGTIFEIGRITVWDPPQRFALTWRQASFAPDEVTEVEVRFEPKGAETQVTVEHRGWDRIPQANAARHGMPDAVYLRRHGEYWQGLLSSFSRAAMR
jgi:uncharacterized protein YndB with AHSA1/START domain